MAEYPADNTLLTNKIRDELARRLGNDWASFARETGCINEPQIDNINIDVRLVYDKGYRMLMIWEQNSPIKVTIGMVKSILVKMVRNDILLEIFNYVPVVHATEASSIHTNTNTLEPTISQLKFKYIKKLQAYLDPDHGISIGNWKELGDTIFQGNANAKDRVKSLHLNYCGGGSPASSFLRSLEMRNPTYTVGEFIYLAKEHERQDISSYLESQNCPGKQFRELTESQKHKVSINLDKNLRGVSDWRSFADDLGYSADEIDQFRVAVKDANRYSPTDALIKYIKESYPSMKLSSIKMASSRIGRNDVAQFLGDVIEEMISANST